MTDAADGPPGVWLEGWETRHPINGLFEPPLTLASE